MASSGLVSGFATDKKNVQAPGVKQAGAPEYGKQGGDKASPYQGNLRTDFSGYRGSPNVDNNDISTWTEDSVNDSINRFQKYQNDRNSNDADVKRAADLQWELDNPNGGTDGAAMGAELNAVRGRIGIKNSLAEQIGGADDLLKQEQDLNKTAANAAIDSGVKNTRQNYNGRGLLYSGMRQGGEQKVKSQGASQLAGAMASTARESANAKSAAQNAYASVQFANQQETFKRAEEAFDTANANSIARRQAMQSLGGGLGSAAGSYFGGRSPSGGGNTASNPAAGYEFNGLQRTGLLSEGAG